MTGKKTKIILHAEDDPAHAAIIRMVIELSAVTIQLMQVEDGKEALDYLYRQESFADPAVSPRPDLVLLDLRMPRIDGLGVLAAVKKDPALKAIPVVMLTTSASEKDRSEAQSCGADDYLTKPVNFDEFVNMMEELCATWLGAIWEGRKATDPPGHLVCR